ncbi:DUF1127 domain-containing protein (plasmid) [Skermanella mucosa]|uniref:DUF1127 domain-containing protein n=1 Tax=Skermanella mucosa TaxID=1789672 RepID=UPI00192BC5BD|nr:DUF1127 domain-containing protein [Skermanella mucosa]UEM24978.1 DUF1127 domain-containing protein [Skermanella mucosa]
MNLVELDRFLPRSRLARRGLLPAAAAVVARWIGLDPISRAEKRLHEMTDGQLADIGITRAQIADAVRYGRGAPSGRCAEIIPMRRRPTRPSGGPDVPHAA